MNSDEAVICLIGQSALDRAAYRLLLERELGPEVAVEASFAPVSISAALRSRPDLVVVDTDSRTPRRYSPRAFPRSSPARWMTSSTVGGSAGSSFNTGTTCSSRMVTGSRVSATKSTGGY